MTFRIFVLSLPLFLCTACALPRSGPSQDADEARRVWERFAARGAAAETTRGPFRVAGTLRYTDADGQSTRVSSLLWGNGEIGSPYPLRLDLIAGVGNVVAKILEDASSFLTYVPNDNTAYTSDQGLYTLLAFGVPIPLTLRDLALLLTGRGSALFLPDDGRAATAVPEQRSVTDNGFSYVLTRASLPGILELSPLGAPLSWRGEGNGGWRMTFEPRTDNPLLLKRLRIEHAKGYSVLVVVREFDRLPTVFSPEQLTLPLPKNAIVKKLDN